MNQLAVKLIKHTNNAVNLIARLRYLEKNEFDQREDGSRRKSIMAFARTL